MTFEILEWNHVKFVTCVLEFRPPLPPFSSFAFWARILLFWCVLCLKETSPWIRILLNHCDDSNPSSLVSNPLESASSHELKFITFLSKPQSTLIFPRILKFLQSFGRDLLGICSRGSCEGILQVSLDLDFVCSRFNIWSLVHGLSRSNRSDWSKAASSADSLVIASLASA